MASADQIKALVRSHAAADDERFYAIALQIAATAARTGHGRFAQDLRDLVDKARTRRASQPPNSALPLLVQPRGELAGLLAAAYPKVRLSDMALDHAVRARIEEVLLEQRQRERIQSHGFAPHRKLLLLGPPGTGKTMTAGVLASELAMPLFTIQLDGLITKFLGETAAKLRLVFDAIQHTRGVYLFDEFDALGGERGTRNDVGEIRRVLNSFLQFLDHDSSDSVIVAATNHPDMLDRALFRRFDAVIEYGLPSREVAQSVIRGRLALVDVSGLAWDEVLRASEGLSHADLARACDHAAKRALLDDRTQVATKELLQAMTDRRQAQASRRA